MAYFSALGGTGGTSATITVTYSEDFYGVTITATNGTTTLTKTATSSGTLVFDVSEGGTWVVSGTVEGATYSESVDVTFEYTAPPLVALPDGSTALPVNDIQMWLKCAAIRDKTTYTTLADVLADTETFIALCADSNACDYMARSTTWASGVAADSTAMLIVGKYNYCANALLDDNTWETAIQNSPYSDYVNPDPSAGYIPLVPKMTSNTTPSGEVIISTNNANAYKAFDGVYGSVAEVALPNSVGAFIGYKYTVNTPIVKFKFVSNWSNGNIYKIQGFDGTNWNDITTFTATGPSSDSSYSEQLIDIPQNTNYSGYRAYLSTKVASGSNSGIWEIQFYRKSDLPIIHSAVEDSIFYMDDGSHVPLCGIPVGDTIDVDLEAYKGQTLTLVSTVAKDTTNLSNDYSKSIRITPNITEIYLMPYGTLYWWGSEYTVLTGGSNLAGWTNTTGGTTVANGTYNKNTYSNGNGASAQMKGYGTVNKIDITDFDNLKVLITEVNHQNYGCYLQANSSKTVLTHLDATPPLPQPATRATTIGTTALDISSYSGDYGIAVYAYGANIYSIMGALWLE